MMPHRAWIATVAILVVVLTLGCASESRLIPRADHMHGPLPHQARRQPDYASQTFWSRLSPEAYESIEHLPATLSVDQELAVLEFGAPDYQREFESLEGEQIVEWLSIDHNLLFQFVEGELIFQGEIRDLEHTLLRHGQPNDVLYHQFDPQIERMTFIYSGAYSSARMYFDFADGHLVAEERHP